MKFKETILLPTSWAVLYQSIENGKFVSSVIAYLAKYHNSELLGGASDAYYGINQSGNVDYTSKGNFDTILTLDEFIDLVFDYEPTFGELVEVSDDGVSWKLRTYISTSILAPFPHFTCETTQAFDSIKTGCNAELTGWKQLRQIVEPVNVKIELTSEEVFDILAKAKGVKTTDIKIIDSKNGI